MRNNNIVLVLFFSIIMLAWNVLLAQETAIKKGTYVVKDITYEVGAPSRYGSTPIWRRDIPKLKPNREFVDNIALDYIETKVTNHEMWRNRVKAVLGKTKQDALSRAGERLILRFEFSPDGKILNIAFSVKTGTVLTLADIASIDRDLRKNYIATFSSLDNGHKHLYWIAINGELDFAK
ncbi:hypothetical protein [Sphingobacterium yanglingense]|uniref:Uncharacterized protein n=1 Tax=Sphingobacterium yanglingense TaxID=1437280 RepID=A0A4R6WLW9_9SPHI|nr:hypothetical protein [Sphingobacterium yanglingense]TDQ79071.1 hypothetical protein CLV99_0503 [Sphingobacterium yanglingense]